MLLKIQFIVLISQKIHHPMCFHVKLEPIYSISFLGLMCYLNSLEYLSWFQIRFEAGRLEGFKALQDCTLSSIQASWLPS
jgi:hypothetical protein